MPGFLNSLQPPTSPDLLKKFFRAKKSKLSRHETEILKNQIASARTQILELEGHVKSLQDDTSTICHNIQHRQPAFTPPIVIRLPETFQRPAVTSSRAKASPNKPRRKWFSTPLLRPHSTSNDDKPEIHAALSKYPPDVSEAERDNCPPASISSEDMALMADSESDLQVQLDLLVSRKAELVVELRKLEANLLFWKRLQKRVRSEHREGVKEQERGISHFCTWRPPRPSLLGQWAFDADSIPSEYTKVRGSDISLNLSNPKKTAPIREMIARIKSTALWPGTKRDYY